MISTKKKKHCIVCGIDDTNILYKSNKMNTCYDCQNYFNLSKKKTGEVEMTLQEFLKWKREDPNNRICVYCKIDSDSLYQLNIINHRNKKAYESIGVDRIINNLPYCVDNIQSCCGICNQIKSNIFNHQEMIKFGVVVNEVWTKRLNSGS